MLATTDLRQRNQREDRSARHYFKPNASGADLGIHARIGSVVTAGHDFPANYVRRIRLEIGGLFRPLMSHVLWQSPNGGYVWTQHHVLAYYNPHPQADHIVLDNLLLPFTKVHGMRYENPLICVNTLDGLSDEERDRGVLPRFEQFDERLFNSMKKKAYEFRNEGPVRARKERARLLAEQDKRLKTSRKIEFNYRRAGLMNRFARLETGGDNQAFVASDKVLAGTQYGLPMEGAVA